MGIESIGGGIATRLKTISGLKVYAPSELPDSISQFPVALILPRITEYKKDFDGSADYIFRIIVCLTSSDRPSAMNKLLDYIEPTGTYSIVAAIDGDKTLNGTADSSEVTENTGFGAINWGGYLYLGTEFERQFWV